MKKLIAISAIAFLVGGISMTSYGQDGEKKSNTKKTEKVEKKKCEKGCCTKSTETTKTKK